MTPATCKKLICVTRLDSQDYLSTLFRFTSLTLGEKSRHSPLHKSVVPPSYLVAVLPPRSRIAAHHRRREPEHADPRPDSGQVRGCLHPALVRRRLDVQYGRQGVHRTVARDRKEQYVSLVFHAGHELIGSEPLQSSASSKERAAVRASSCRPSSGS